MKKKYFSIEELKTGIVTSEMIKDEKKSHLRRQTTEKTKVLLERDLSRLTGVCIWPLSVEDGPGVGQQYNRYGTRLKQED